ncbi:hypothetical protein I305_04964 [Cryptococcus gattii E566]|uniref:PH domain-containing protein n=2 Tax=Cryptococcus gattii TaxID=37769 RepID=E6RBW5_CRYGW|nr:Hypothetical protein CGB_I1380C [Cryptococcus gattii WM276]ADV24305.1 Hypothetical protein CGB_I1380C [Cryptococcus gattii WM276]KIR76303.1 hypothetical protein I306_06636 [Cryptococcus gattii EJB2]KIY32398.1 hypothetical protein I305_04964 [Cryptococcus gattii E566]KJE02503.1 hypothetical protein I311_03689 [Cryptococcus gattii NT-10]
MPARRIEKTGTVRGLVQRPDVEKKEDLRSSPQEPPRHPRLDLPAPSPPLLPPNPPYMTRSTSCGPTESGTPPDVPLPPAPIATPLSDSSSSTSPIKRSGSTPMLLPRSRSTSMSLKSPPTSSSFFDLYEQLGIWPKGETEEKKHDGILDKSEESVKSSPEDKLADGTVKQYSSKASPAADLIPTKAMSLSSPVMGASSSAWGPVLGHVSEGPSSPASAHGRPFVNAPPSSADAKSDDQQQQTSLSNLVGPSEEVVDPAEEITPNAKPSSSRSSDSYPAALEISTFTVDPRLSSDTQPTSVAMSIKNSRASRRFDVSTDPSSRDEARENLDMGGIEKVDNDEDDLPLSRTHANTAAAQQQRREVRQTPERSQTLSKVKVRGRNPGGDTDWDGEGGVPADVLTTKLEKALVMMEKMDLMRSVSHRHVSQADGKPVLPLQINRRPTWSESLTACELSPVDAVSRRPESPLPPIPKPPVKLLSAMVVSDKSTKQITFELQPKTTARDVLVDACKNGDLKESKNGMSWVLCEVFVEMDCERYVREYETLQSIISGWDISKGNRFEVRQSARGRTTSAKTVPTTPPMYGAWVLYETKKGKWSKRWLETRGGHVFLSKNGKGKDEVHLNTLFFDVYTMLGDYDKKSYVFTLKRGEISANFVDLGEYRYVFTCDGKEAWKLVSSIYDAKSYTLAQAHPHEIAAQRTAQLSQSPGNLWAADKASVPSSSRRLVELGKQGGQEEKASPVTAKGIPKF